MDTRDFLLTADETFDTIADRLDAHAVSGVQAIAEDGVLTLSFDGGTSFTLSADGAAQLLLLDMDEETPRAFRYHEVEEEWYDTGTEEELFTALSRIVGSALGTTVSLIEA